MNTDNKLMMEAMHNHAQRIITSELHKVHTILNQLSTMIDLNRSAETDQLLSKIRDVSEMLMTDSPAENAEQYEQTALWAIPSCRMIRKLEYFWVIHTAAN